MDQWPPPAPPSLPVMPELRHDLIQI